MKSLNSFLNPKRKPNLKLAVSEAFQREDGSLIEWEMRQLSAKEGVELQRAMDSDDYIDIMTCYVANSLVYPDLRDKDLQDALSEREGRPIRTPEEALKCIVTDGELSRLINAYNNYNSFSEDFMRAVNDAKN